MNDKYQSNSEFHEENDPLAELARIVAGEDGQEEGVVENDLYSPATDADGDDQLQALLNSDAFNQSAQAPAEAVEDSLFSTDQNEMLSGLEDALQTETAPVFTQQVDAGIRPEASLEVETNINENEAALENLAAAMQQFENDLDADVARPVLAEEPIDAPEQTLYQEVDNTSEAIEQPTFVDDINAAFDNELAKHIEPEPIDAPSEPRDTAVFDTVEAHPEVPSFQDDLMNSLEAELGPMDEVTPQHIEPAYPVEDEYIPQALDTTELSVEHVASEPTPEYTEEVSDTSDIYSEIDGQIEASFNEKFEAQVEVEQNVLEDDLGAAFQNEVANIMESNVRVEEVPVTDIPFEHEPAIAVQDEAPQYFEAPDVPISFEETHPEVFAGIEPQSEPEVIEIPTAQASTAPEFVDVELDFETAFAQELDVADLQTSPDFEQTDPLMANAATSFAPQNSVEAGLDSAYLAPEQTNTIPEHSDPYNPDVGVAAASADDGGGKKLAIAAMVIALFAGSIAAGYAFLGGASTDGNVPTIEASTDPIKVKPDDPGGRIVANQDNASYEKVEGNGPSSVTQESLISSTEEPADINTDALPSSISTNQPATNLTPKDDGRISASQTETAGASANSTVKPRVVQVVTVKPDGTIVRTPVKKPQLAQEANSQLASAAPSTVKITPKPVQTQTVTSLQSIDGAKTTNQPSVPTLSPKPKPVVAAQPTPVKPKAAPKPAATQTAAKSEWVVQVSSQRSAEAAQQSFNTMRQRFSGLQGRAMSIQRADVNGATYYRVRVQTASRSDANSLCGQISSSGGSCFVTR